VAGNEREKGLGGARPLRIRPPWWVVLALSLSLLALVAARASDHPGTSRPRLPAESIQPTHRGPTRPAPTRTSTTVPPTTTTTAVTAATTPVGALTDTIRGNDASTPPPLSPTTTTTTPTVTATTGPALAAAAAQPAASDFDRLSTLDQPTLASATYAFYGVGSMTVSVTWDYATPLSLTVNCPGGAETVGGLSPLAVVIPNAGGPCDTTLKETLVQYNLVDFTMLIHPTDGE
jgi:hypothetical protein